MLSALVVAGCVTTPLAGSMRAPGYLPTNFSKEAARLPLTLRRVAVLPLAVSGQDALRQAGREMLEPVLQAELGKAKVFELAVLSPAQLRHWTGRDTWTGMEELPADFFQRLQARTGCDAVLFAQLTHFQAYPPLAVGWNLRLVDCQQKTILWAVDEILDASQPAVANGARNYARTHSQGRPTIADSWSILHSPRRFGTYTASLVLETLPER